MENSLIGAFLDAHPVLRKAPFACVSSTGNDATGTIGDPERPFASASAALASEAAVIMLEDGVYAPPEYLSTTPKLIIARNAGRARWEMPGSDLSRTSWTTNGGIVTTRVSAIVQRVVNNDQKDGDGFPARLRKHSTLGALAEEGWFFDPDTSELHVRTASDPRRLKAYYLDRANRARLFVGGGVLCTHGVDYSGVGVVIDHNGVEVPEIWLSHFTSVCAAGFAAHAPTGGNIFMESGRIHAPEIDGHNVDYANESGIVVAAGIHTTEAGDMASFGKPEHFNRQAGSSHSGFAAVFGCIAQRSLGQEYADTTLPFAPNFSWYVGNIVGDDRHEALDGSMGFHAQGKSEEGPDNRIIYLDTNEASGVTFPLTLESFAVGHVFNNSFGAEVRAVGGSALPNTYRPDDPDRAARLGF